MSYYILLKGKKARRWSGAIPARKGASRSSLESLIRRSLSKRYSAKVITGDQMKVLVARSKKRLRLVKPVKRK